MLLYEYCVRDEFDRVKQYAENLQDKFAAGSPVEELRKDRDNLASLCASLTESLPREIAGRSNLERHLGWMKRNLSESQVNACKGDIQDICRLDLPTLEKLFRDWCASSVHYDKELAEKLSNLLMHREFDSAIRKAFVVLKSRLVLKFHVPDDLDGQELVNKVFGGQGILASKLSQDERQPMRDMLAGFYGLFRNEYMHNDVETPWYEADAVLSIINLALKRIDSY